MPHIDPPNRDAYMLIPDLLLRYAAIAVERGARPGDRVSTFFSDAEIAMIKMDALKYIFGNPRLDSVIGIYISTALAHSHILG